MAGRVAYYGGIVKDGLVLDLDAAKKASYPGSGTTWFDVSGYGYNGTLVNGPTFDSANAGSVVFDGVNDYLVRTDASLRNYTTVTANIWMYLNTYTSTFETYFSYNAEEAGPSGGFGLRRWGNAIFECWGGSSRKLYKNNTLLISGSSVLASGYNTTGSWEMITLVANSISTWQGHNRLTLATRSDGLNTATNYKVGSFSLYNRELSTAEITQNYNALKGRYGL